MKYISTAATVGLVGKTLDSVNLHHVKFYIVALSQENLHRLMVKGKPAQIPVNWLIIPLLALPGPGFQENNVAV